MMDYLRNPLVTAPRARDIVSLRLERCLTSRQAADEVLDALEKAFIAYPGYSYDEDVRYQHADLEGLDDVALWREVERARFLLAWIADPHPWVKERLEAVQAEQVRRKGGRV